MKKWWLLPPLLCLLGLFFLPDPIPGWERPEELTLSQSFQIQKELRQALPLAGDRDGIETALIHQGFSVEDTDPNYPSYLVNSAPLRAFAAGEAASCSLFRVGEDYRISHLFFSEEMLVLTTMKQEQVTECELLPLYEAEVSAWDVFYYRCYPENDPHYADYNLIRLKRPNRELWDLTKVYILPVGYQMVNLFLTDWQEGDWTQVCLNDTFEYLYALETGEDFPWWEMETAPDSQWYAIDSTLFESVLLPYFNLTRQELRSLCRYDAATGTYPWRPVEGNDIITLDHSLRQPEVTAVTDHPDGTRTLTVQVGCPDKKTNNRFTHEVTIRPTETGFQYVRNRVTYVSDLGLPPAMARFALCS